MSLFQHLWELLFPRKCVFCGGFLGQQETDLCAACRKVEPFDEKPRRIPYVSGWTAAYYYEGPVREGLLRFKFGGRQSYAESYGRMLAMAVRRAGLEFDVLTYVPVSPRRRKRRGYDQDQLLAEAAGENLGCRAVCLLKKVRDNPAQSGLKDTAERHANVMGAYEVIDPAMVAGKRILLVDDILTTGATVSECARVLLTAGASRVQCACFGARRE